MKKTFLLIYFSVLVIDPVLAQDYRWQQRAEYFMEVHLDVRSHKLTGNQKLIYHNNSNDTLSKVYYHLYFNAFQPGSMMDIRSHTIADPDPRVKGRIAALKENEIGYQRIKKLSQDNKETAHEINGTLLEVTLAKPILPNTKTTFDMEFEAQVPIQIRRCGRDNSEGIAYSMTQWYPKMAEYDFRGWHTDPYVSREFHGVWGDFDVKITLDADYIIGGTGVLQNADEVGYGYEKEGIKVKRKKGDLTWHFLANNVHDFAWAADPDYTHDIARVPDGPELHFFYQKNEKTAENWKKLQGYAISHFQYMNGTYGKYPYETYSVIQGGDRGMEYPMCTLITGERTIGSLTGTMVHEVSHSWFHGVLANNELLHHWMDEGFSDFVSYNSMAKLFNQTDPPLKRSYTSYFNLIKSGLQEPASEHADHYTTNRAYSTAAYAMGAMFLAQIKYIIGDDNFYKGMRRYYEQWKFRHPEPNDFIQVMEKESGIQLHWFYNYWINTTKHIDYGIESVDGKDNKTIVTLKRFDELPMPVELLITHIDGTKELYYIPLSEMNGSKPAHDKSINRIDLNPWAWVDPSYTIVMNHSKDQIAKIEIDPERQVADIRPVNNLVVLQGNLPQGSQSGQN